MNAIKSMRAAFENMKEDVELVKDFYAMYIAINNMFPKFLPWVFKNRSNLITVTDLCKKYCTPKLLKKLTSLTEADYEAIGNFIDMREVNRNNSKT